MKLIKYLISLVAFLTLCAAAPVGTARDPLPSWNDGPAKKSIIDFVRATTSETSPDFVPEDERIATFDQDGTLWVEHPIYAQLQYCFDRVNKLVQEKPELKNVEPFKTVLSGNQKELASLSYSDLKKIAIATLTGMSVEEFQNEVRQWITTAKDHRWNRLYIELKYQPMIEVLQYLRSSGYKTYIVTGGGQDFVRVYAQETYGIPPEQVIGSAVGISFGYDKSGKPLLTRDPKLFFNDNDAGKPEGIHLQIGRRPYAAFGNSTGDKQMLEYTHFGQSKRLAMLVLHDDPIREYAYGPAQGLPDTKIGTFTQALYDEAKEKEWIVISMKKDWKQIFSFEQTQK